jgi:hypothetical protein
MSHNIRQTVPKVLQTLWDLEKELRGAARNSVVLRRDDAKRHLSEARRHLDALLGLAQNDHPKELARQNPTDTSSVPPSIKH